MSLYTYRKSIRRWDSERELSLRRHPTWTTRYSDIAERPRCRVR